jgi:IS5 family transposase
LALPSSARENGLLDAAMTEINAQLAEQSLIIKQGLISIIDASVIEAKNARPRKNAEGKNTQDPEAGYSVKQSSDGKRKTTYGFKAHTNVDEDGFVKEVMLTAGNVHDSIPFESILTDHEREVYADSTYKSAQHSRLLKQKRSKNALPIEPIVIGLLTRIKKSKTAIFPVFDPV